MKKLLKACIVAVLAWQVRRLRAKHEFKVVGVAGSYGKTSTKAAVAQVLSAKYAVQWQEGNYNDIISVPLVFFGLTMPSLYNPIAWFKVFWEIEQQLKDAYKYEIVVVELGTDGPHQMKLFERYLKLDLALITSIGPEHMEYFKNVEEVAKEELSVAKYSKRTLVNASLVDAKYIQLSPYELEPYRVTIPKNKSKGGWNVQVGSDSMSLSYPLVSDVQAHSLSSAYVVGLAMDMNHEELVGAFKKVSGMYGRMNILAGKKGSQIIDDSYNSSPEAAKLALDTLYNYPTNRRIALLGNMNELGSGSARFHTEVGQYCDPGRLDLVVTLGPDANEYLAAAAESAGCKVERTQTPYEAGERIAKELGQNTAVLVKGSQNGVYAEEAIKKLLANPADESKLVRQSAAWTRKKLKNFPEKTDG